VPDIASVRFSGFVDVDIDEALDYIPVTDQEAFRIIDFRNARHSVHRSVRLDYPYTRLLRASSATPRIPD
jgi:hypothetical protein